VNCRRYKTFAAGVLDTHTLKSHIIHHFLATLQLARKLR